MFICFNFSKLPFQQLTLRWPRTPTAHEYVRQLSLFSLIITIKFGLHIHIDQICLSVSFYTKGAAAFALKRDL